jgi:hypothetical protein
VNMRLAIVDEHNAGSDLVHPGDGVGPWVRIRLTPSQSGKIPMSEPSYH